MLTEAQSQAIWPRNPIHSTEDPRYLPSVASPAISWSQRYAEYLLTPHWKQLSHRIRIRDGFRCVMCNSGKLIDVHHRTYERLGFEDEADLYTVCRSCHSLHHGKAALQWSR